MRVRTVVVVLAVAVVGVGIFLGLSGHHDHCGVSEDLATARMLDDADAMHDRGDCSSADTEMAREQASASFARADVRASAAAAARAQAASLDKTDTEAVKAAKARAAKADEEEVDELVAGLARDPFREGRLAMLDGSLARIAEVPAGRAATACRVAEEAVHAGLLPQAAVLIGRALPNDTGHTCDAVGTALAAARAKALAARRMAVAERADGDDVPARRDDARALRADTSLTASRSALVAATADDDSRLTDGIQGVEAFPAWLGDAWPSLLVALVGGALCAVLAFQLLRGLAARKPWVRRWLLPQDSRSRAARRIARLHVRVGSFTGGKDGELAGQDVATLLEHSLTPHGPAAFPFDRLPSAATTGQTIKDVATFLGEVPHGDVAAALLRLLPSAFAPRTAVVEGRLLPIDATGAGLAVSVAAPDGDVYGDVIRERRIDPVPHGTAPERQGRLVAPASVLVRRHLAVLAGDPKPDDWDDEIAAEMLATAGEEWSAAGELSRAATCFVRALERNPRLIPARHNLAVAELRMGAYPAAVARLKSLIADLDTNDALRVAWPAALEAAKYNLALALVYV